MCVEDDRVLHWLFHSRMVVHVVWTIDSEENGRGKGEEGNEIGGIDRDIPHVEYGITDLLISTVSILIEIGDLIAVTISNTFSCVLGCVVQI